MNSRVSINAPSPQSRCGPGPQRGFTLVEVMVAMGIGMVTLAAVAATTVFCLRSFAGIYNYSDLNASSRLALDTMSREIRGASYVDDYQSSTTGSFIRVVNTNTASPITNTFAWSPSEQTLTWSNSTQEPITLLTKCTNWSCTLLEGYASNNYSFPDIAPKPAACKIVDMRWSCFRTILGIKMNSETEQGGQIVLRN